MTTEDGDRVRANTSAEVNAKIDHQTKENVNNYAGASREEITRRIEELEREWDMERVLETNASALAITGLGIFVITKNRKWLFVPGVVMSFLFQHAVQGWCPPVPVFRRLGVRTRQEIDSEKYALKVLRGDFSEVSSETANDTFQQAKAALSAVEK
jgi:hypothetical protein